ncbi:MAG: Hsp20/alpha crystallin family protein [Sulfurimonas sp.]|nr:Hsp20/alpha crystallin family protein [Sulfurimonadaceae bacterium]
MLVSRYFNQPQNRRRRGYDFFDNFFNAIEKDEDSVIVDFKPAINTREGSDAYHIDVDLPGVKKEDINIDITDNVLTISGTRESKIEQKEQNYYKVESSYGKFQRSFTLPKEVDVENIRAACEDGVLEVIIPKLEVSKQTTKKIEVK